MGEPGAEEPAHFGARRFASRDRAIELSLRGRRVGVDCGLRFVAAALGGSLAGA
jgi:hypothetical protein